MSDIKEKEPAGPDNGASVQRPESTGAPAKAPVGGRPAASPDASPRSTTHQEVAYLRRLIDANATVTVKIRGGDIVRGVIEYYDASFIRLTRPGQPNLFIFKKDIMYLEEEAPAAS